MSLSLDPIKPYVDLIKIGLIVLFALVLVGMSAFGGYKAAASNSVEKLAERDKRIASLEASLNDFITLYDRVNAASTKELKAADDRRKAAEAAAKIASDAEAAARRESNEFEARWEKAKKQKPGCAELLATNMEAVCGLQLR